MSTYEYEHELMQCEAGFSQTAGATWHSKLLSFGTQDAGSLARLDLFEALSTEYLLLESKVVNWLERLELLQKLQSQV